MNAFLMLYAVSILISGGVFCAVLGKYERLANRLGAAVGVLGAIPAVLAAGHVLLTGQRISFQVSWSIPFGSFYVAMDGLSAFFVLAIAVICALAAIYGSEYLKIYFGRKNLGVSWFFYHVLFASMLLVVIAQNGVLFLLAWEAMSLASFFLVMFEHEKEEVRQAGWTYLVATHLGTAFLLALFVLLGWQNQTMDFDKFAAPISQTSAGALFVLAVIGFGTKAGFLPMHVWLPEAHPAAPSHVSAVMSGVMIKTGIYGLLRTLTFLETPPAWWGWVMIGIGAASCIGGILFALAQRDLKRLLAYSSVENIGIICLGLGLWLVGAAIGNAQLAVFGLLGSLLHIWNHAIFKSLMFFGAGAIAHATGTRNIEQLGGLLKKMPRTGLTFLIGAAAICGLPPLNGFVSEFLIYVGAFIGIAKTGILQAAVAGLIVMGALALAGGLAVACFTKVFGIVFLGEPRSDSARHAHEAPLAMRWVLVGLAGLCLLIGLLGLVFVLITMSAAEPLAKLFSDSDVHMLPAFDQMEIIKVPLLYISIAGAAVVVLALILLIVRWRLLAGRSIKQAGTWDCGYAAPNERMQYTASSFAWPILNMFRRVLWPQVHLDMPPELFPKHSHLETHTEDIFRRYGYVPLFGAFALLAEKIRWLQQGRNQLYVLYIALTLLALLLWKLGWQP